jgi:alpha-beta hydrolase superfamily lysophospholipase
MLESRWKPAMPKINRDGVEIYYEVRGSGPPLLLTHGYSSTSAMWEGQIEALSKHHKLVLWDMRGHGQSDYPTDPSQYSEALTVADMAACSTKSAPTAPLSVGCRWEATCRWRFTAAIRSGSARS